MIQHFKQTARPNNSNWSHVRRQVLDVRTNAKRLHRSAWKLTTMMHTNRQQQKQQKGQAMPKMLARWNENSNQQKATPTPAWYGSCCIFVFTKNPTTTHTHRHTQSGHCCKCFQWAEITETSFACHEGPSLELFVCDAFFCRLFLSFGPLLARFKLYLHSICLRVLGWKSQAVLAVCARIKKDGTLRRKWEKILHTPADWSRPDGDMSHLVGMVGQIVLSHFSSIFVLFWTRNWALRNLLRIYTIW